MYEFCTCGSYPLDNTGNCLFCGKPRYDRVNLSAVPYRWRVDKLSITKLIVDNLPKVVVTKCLLCGKISYDGNECLNIGCSLYRRRG